MPIGGCILQELLYLSFKWKTKVKVYFKKTVYRKLHIIGKLRFFKTYCTLQVCYLHKCTSGQRSTLTVHDMFVWSTGCQLNVWCMSNSDRIYTRVSEKLNQRCKLVIFVLISTPIITGITSFHPSIPIFYYKSQFPCLLGKVMIDT